MNSMRSTAEHDFTDLVSGRECTLVIPPDGRVFPKPGEPKTGIRHPDCGQLADVSVGLDAFFCTKCQWNGRVPGVWCIEKIEAASTRPASRAEHSSRETRPLIRRSRPTAPVSSRLAPLPKCWRRLLLSVNMPPPFRCREGHNFMTVRPKCRTGLLLLLREWLRVRVPSVGVSRG